MNSLKSKFFVLNLFLMLAGVGFGVTYDPVRQDPTGASFVRYFEDATLGAEFVAGGGLDTIGDDSTNVQNFSDRANADSMAISIPADDVDSYLDWKFPEATGWPSLDLADYDIEIVIYIPPENIDRWASSGLWVQMLDGSAADTLFSMTKSVIQNNNDGGWFSFRKSLTPYALGSNVDPSGYDGMRFRMFTTSGVAEHMMTIDKIAFYPKRSITHYAYTADDGNAGDYKVAEYLHSKGIRGTFCINGDSIGGDTPPKLTVAQMTTMQSWGMLFINHGLEHLYPTYDSGVLNPHRAPSEMIDDIQNGAEWLYTRGFTRGANIYAIAGTVDYWTGWDYDQNTVWRYVSLMRSTAAFSANGSDVFKADYPWGNITTVPTHLFGYLENLTGAIRTLTVFATADSGAATKITTSAAHGFKTGGACKIAGTLTGYLDGLQEITYVDATNFTVPVAYVAEAAQGTAQVDIGAFSLVTDWQLEKSPLVVIGFHNVVDSDCIGADGEVTQEFTDHIDLIAQKKADGKLLDITLDQLVLGNGIQTETGGGSTGPTAAFPGSGFFP